jgi:hypothetical protein
MQIIIVGLIVAAAFTYAARVVWRALAAARKTKPGACGPDCGCGQSRASR